MNDFLNVISKNPTSTVCVPSYTKEKAELRRINPTTQLWGAYVRTLIPNRLTTAWCMLEDPLMVIAGNGYCASEVREKTFRLQQEAVSNLRGNRKLTKAKMGDALSAMKPTVDQTKIVAAVLFALKQIQTICFDEQAKTIWTMPEDLRVFSSQRQTLWVDARCEQMLDWKEEQPNVGLWLNDREREGWSIEWPIAEGTLESMKKEVEAFGLQPHPREFGAKLKKEDWARTLGKAQAIEHLSAGDS